MALAQDRGTGNVTGLVRDDADFETSLFGLGSGVPNCSDLGCREHDSGRRLSISPGSGVDPPNAGTGDARLVLPVWVRSDLPLTSPTA